MGSISLLNYQDTFEYFGIILTLLSNPHAICSQIGTITDLKAWEKVYALLKILKLFFKEVYKILSNYRIPKLCI